MERRNAPHIISFSFYSEKQVCTQYVCVHSCVSAHAFHRVCVCVCKRGVARGQPQLLFERKSLSLLLYMPDQLPRMLLDSLLSPPISKERWVCWCPHHVQLAVWVSNLRIRVQILTLTGRRFTHWATSPAPWAILKDHFFYEYSVSRRIILTQSQNLPSLECIISLIWGCF